jgi:mono/diheme cytochrome c family protein
LLAGLYFVIVSAAGAAEKDITIPRVPPDQIQAAKAMRNPLPPTPENIVKGKAIYVGKGICFTCHGISGKGDGDAGKVMNPSPRDFTNPEFHELRTDGELFWVIKHGIAGTGMISFNPSMITDEETWQVILYMRTFKEK